MLRCARPLKPATVLFEGDDPRAYIIASNIARRHMSKGQQAMAVAIIYPEPAKTKRKRSGSLEPRELAVDRLGLTNNPWIKHCRASHLAACGHTVLPTR